MSINFYFLVQVVCNTYILINTMGECGEHLHSTHGFSKLLFKPEFCLVCLVCLVCLLYLLFAWIAYCTQLIT